MWISQIELNIFYYKLPSFGHFIIVMKNWIIHNRMNFSKAIKYSALEKYRARIQALLVLLKNRCCYLEQSVSLSNFVPLEMVLPLWKKAKCWAQPFSFQPNLTCGFCYNTHLRNSCKTINQGKYECLNLLRVLLCVSKNMVNSIFSKMYTVPMETLILHRAVSFISLHVTTRYWFS